MCNVFLGQTAFLLNREQNPEECDATGFHSSNAAWPIIKKLAVNNVTINICRNQLPKLTHTAPTNFSCTFHLCTVNSTTIITEKI